MLYLIYGLLGIAVLIALMGIGNTLSLSIHERTRELGLLRAVGQTRSQVRSALRWESVIVAVFGTRRRLGLGTFLGWGLMRASARPGGFGCSPCPSRPLVVILVLAAVAGVVAALRPARRAARLDILDAIDHAIERSSPGLHSPLSTTPRSRNQVRLCQPPPVAPPRSACSTAAPTSSPRCPSAIITFTADRHPPGDVRRLVITFVPRGAVRLAAVRVEPGWPTSSAPGSAPCWTITSPTRCRRSGRAAWLRPLRQLVGRAVEEIASPPRPPPRRRRLVRPRDRIVVRLVAMACCRRTSTSCPATRRSSTSSRSPPTAARCWPRRRGDRPAVHRSVGDHRHRPDRAAWPGRCSGPTPRRSSPPR